MKIRGNGLNIKIGAFVLAGGLALGGYSFTSFNDHTQIVTVTDKERINKGGSSKYIVWGEDENGEIHAFENTDNMLRLKWNSSDIQGNLKEGETYKLNLIGYRFRMFNKYENIISSTPVEKTLTK